MARISSIDLVFEREDDGSFTKRALMRQDILRYATQLRKSLDEVPFFPKLPEMYTFKETPLLHWVVDHNLELQDRFHGTTINQANKISNSRTLISGRLADLTSLGLVMQLGTTIAERTHEEIPQFAFLPSGVLLAYLIDNINRVNVEHVETIWKVVLAYSWGQTARRVFLQSFFKRSMERGLFHLFVKNFVKNLNDRKIDFEKYGSDVMVIFMSFIFASDPRDGLDRGVAELWLESLAAMDGEAKQLFLYSLKQRLESNNSWLDVKRETEILRWSSSPDYSKIVIELLCDGCVRTSPVTIDIMDLVRFISLANPCPHCHKKDGLVVPIDRFINELI